MSAETDLCPLCSAWVESGAAHRACALQDVLGPIGHVLDHRYWCVVRCDPYAGLTRRQSALCVLALVSLHGAESVVSGEFDRPPFDVLVEWVERIPRLERIEP